ncbi:hypothetical protein JTE90_027661 [Oedothorax gibbosus]|uniref:Uncharacterized protein n=1 Tax=Oedothorax gibbosus TaxID=931172 RepID=A0AAV6UP50_9ARAC|nr:hypothetical protein JTE90_027661 [Oedothorax gibbosus]
MPPRKKSLGKRTRAERTAAKKGRETPEDLIDKVEKIEPATTVEAKTEDIIQESEVKSAELAELHSKFSDLNEFYRATKSSKWDEKCWFKYVYRSRDVNPLILPEVNAYLTELDEDDQYDIAHVFEECHKSQNMCEELKLALLECPVIPTKTLRYWIESIKNLQCMVRKKIDKATFRILRGANENINDETFNMEYGIRDNSGAGFILCLWGNLAKNLRHRGMELTSVGFSFDLPPELAKVNCAVRILHTMFDNVTPLFCESALPVEWKLGELTIKDDYNLSLVDEIYSTDNEEITRELNASEFSETIGNILKQLNAMEIFSKADAEKITPGMSFTPPEEPEITIVEKAEYFPVGGLYYFDLFQLPHQTVKSGCWIFTHWDEQVLQRIPFRTSIIPIRHPKPDMSPAVAAEFADSEIKRFDKEMCSAISVCLNNLLSESSSVLFLEQPLPSFWIPEKKGFTSIGFFETKYDEETGQIQFKTNQFGVIGLLQRRYNNMPYQSWELISGDDPNSCVLNITGMQLAIKIEIGKGLGCIRGIEQDGKSLFPESYSMWMSPAEVIKKLMSMGINIAVEEEISKFIEVSSKNNQLENRAYSCMSMLCNPFNFYWSRWNATVSSDQLVMKYNVGPTDNQDNIIHLLITPEKVLEIKCTETHAKFNDDPVDDHKYHSNLYHLLMEKNDIDPQRETDKEFANAIFYILSTCKLFSCS